MTTLKQKDASRHWFGNCKQKGNTNLNNNLQTTCNMKKQTINSVTTMQQYQRQYNEQNSSITAKIMNNYIRPL